MAELSIEESPPPAAGRFQFRLRSIFILMAIVAFAVGIVPLWYRTMIVPAFLPYYLTPDYSIESDEQFQSEKERAIREANKYTVAFSFIAFIACCGLWYANYRPTKRTSDLWLGLAFGLTLGFVVAPRFALVPYLFTMWLLVPRFDFLFPFRFEEYSPHCVAGLSALCYSSWLLLLRRYQAAVLLFSYRCVYGWIVVHYLENIFSRTID